MAKTPQRARRPASLIDRMMMLLPVRHLLTQSTCQSPNLPPGGVDEERNLVEGQGSCSPGGSEGQGDSLRATLVRRQLFRLIDPMGTRRQAAEGRRGTPELTDWAGTEPRR